MDKGVFSNGVIFVVKRDTVAPRLGQRVISRVVAGIGALGISVLVGGEALRRYADLVPAFEFVAQFEEKIGVVVVRRIGDRARATRDIV